MLEAGGGAGLLPRFPSVMRGYVGPRRGSPMALSFLQTAWACFLSAWALPGWLLRQLCSRSGRACACLGCRAGWVLLKVR